MRGDLMQSNYIAKFSDGKLAALYFNEEGIMARICENGRWLPARTLLKGAQPVFSANFALSGELQIYAQDEKGSVVLISFAGDNISSKVILENHSDNIHAILFSIVGSGGNIGLLYNIPYEERMQKLLVQKLHESGTWDKPEEVDIFHPLANNIFETLRISENHVLVFYRREGKVFGYREISTEEKGDFVPVLRQGENMHDISFFALGDSLHMAYLSSNMFSSRLVYRRKISDSFEAGVVLWEGQWLDNCLISEINGELCIFFQSGGNLYMAKSTDNGISFSKPENYAHKFCRLPGKAVYISEHNDESYKTHHVFVDSVHPWDIQILPDMCNDFYIYTQTEQKSPEIQESTEIAQNHAVLMELMQERLNKVTAENQEQRRQISQMTQIISEYEKKEEEEKAVNEQLAQAKEIIRKKDEEIDALKEKSTQLEPQLSEEQIVNKAAESECGSENKQASAEKLP